MILRVTTTRSCWSEIDEVVRELDDLHDKRKLPRPEQYKLVTLFPSQYLRDSHVNYELYLANHEVCSSRTRIQQWDRSNQESNNEKEVSARPTGMLQSCSKNDRSNQESNNEKEVSACPTGSLARGCVLHGVLIADTLKLEDSVQRSSMQWAATPHPSKSERNIREWPSRSRCSRSKRVLPSPRWTTVEVISYLSDEQLERFRGMAAAALRLEGNKLFQDGSFEATAQASAKCDLQRDRVLALSNKAECFLKLGRFGQCVDAASAALSVDPCHLKSMYQKALALLKLHLYDWSCKLLGDILGVDKAID
ncbi:hypothetical protein SELMODRAFT_411764 [Selaginella moellendorffii]|uniref:Uncharacterized protein n=1 Tax=Selaginella moellendorffii TaxID=88036 RepID=D8RIZ1_SELML|nr:hypothetical protein SELMODRAFT_411764 [Selaginella moellendorffii]